MREDDVLKLLDKVRGARGEMDEAAMRVFATSIMAKELFTKNAGDPNSKLTDQDDYPYYDGDDDNTAGFRQGMGLLADACIQAGEVFADKIHDYIRAEALKAKAKLDQAAPVEKGDLKPEDSEFVSKLLKEVLGGKSVEKPQVLGAVAVSSHEYDSDVKCEKCLHNYGDHSNGTKGKCLVPDCSCEHFHPPKAS